MPKHLKLLFSIVIFIACFAVAKTAYAVTEFVSIVDPDNGAGTSWTSLSAWEQNTQTDLSTSTTKVFSISSASGTFAVGSALVGYTSGATASSTYRTATQVLIYNISGIFQSGETVYIQGQASTTNYVVLSNTGDSAIAVASARSSSGSADVTAVVIDGWTTASTTYIKIWTDPTTGARHDGKRNTSKYRLIGSQNWGYMFGIDEDYVRVEGLQISNTSAANDGGGITISASGGLTSSIRVTDTLVYGSRGSARGLTVGAGTVMLNNVVAMDNASDGIQAYPNGSVNLYAYNSVSVNNGGRGFWVGAWRTLTCKNCYAGGNTGADYAKESADAVLNLTTSYSEDGSQSTTAVAWSTSSGGYFTNVTAGSEDIHIGSASTLKDAGTSLATDSVLPFTQDIDGSYRGAAWDIGADELPTEFVSTICENTSAGGDCANRDYGTLSSWEADVNSNLTASTRRVFSGVRTGTFADGATLTLYRSGVSQGITGVAVATTSSQIFLRSIAGTTTPLNVLTGDQWRLDASNYWTASGTADQLGASPIAVAKIDGAWTSADTTGFSIDSWATSYDNYIKIYTTAMARHQGKWDTNKYRLVVSNSGGITINTGDVKIEGLQVYINSTDNSNQKGIVLGGGSEVAKNYEISHNIIRGNPNNTYAWHYAIVFYTGNKASILKAWDNIIYDWVGPESGGIESYTETLPVGRIYAYNNSFYNCNYGISRYLTDIIVAKNNITQNCTDGYSGTFATSSDYNISNIAGDAPNLTFATTSKIVIFVSTSTSDFHLADTDTSAKGQGTNLYSDANINVTNDIDSAARPATSTIGLNWDIGADQTAVKIYRSIAPSATGALTTGASNALTISSSTSLATFATALADNIGVGDVIIYNTGGTATGTAFIHGRSSSTVYTIKTASGTAPTAVSADTSWSLYRAYTTLANAEAGTENTGVPSAMRNFDAWSGGADLVASNTQMNIAAYANGTTADTAAVTIDGWTTGQQNFIKIYTPVAASEVGTSQRHQGKWDENKYKIEYTAPSDYQNVLRLLEGWAYIDGLQIKGTYVNRTGGYGIELNPPDATTVYVSNNIIEGAASGSSTGQTGIRAQYNATAGTRVVKGWNNIVYNFIFGCIVTQHTGWTTSYWYNNTINSCGDIGYWTNGAAVLKNNITQNNTDGFDGTFNTSSDYNISDLASDAPSPSYRTNQATIVSFVDSANKDFHLAPTDTAALDAGTSSPATDANLSFTDDIDGQLRRPTGGSGAGWDIGADEASVEYVTSVMQSGGNFSTLSAWEAANQVDLTATTTAVFSLSSASGTIPANSSVMGLTSGAVASTTVGSVSTSTQILFYNIASSTFLTGERIYIKGGATTSNYAILSNAGNPAIATAKIDGAWSGADTASVDISGWTTGSTNYIRVYTTPTARHNGKWDEGRYRRTGYIDISEDYVRIEGLQIGVAVTGNGRGIYVTSAVSLTASEIWLSHNIIKATSISGSWNRGIQIDSGAANKIWNNVIYDWSIANSYGINTNNNVAAKSYIYNNTIVNSYNGIHASNFNQIFYGKNNIVQSSTDGYYAGGGWGTGSDYNISNLASDAPSPSYRNGLATTVTFVDEANDDFHLSPSDTVARNAGTSTILWDANLSFTQDIDGSYRGAAWDIGADEVPTEFVSTICENTSAGGGCANLDYRTLSTWESSVNSDLTASGTRIFSGTASGTLASGNTVTLYNGATSTGITGTIQATTSNQILIINIIGTTSPVNVASGTVWQVTAANTWRNSGTADQLGASPIAVAKIDGAWASPDITSTSIYDWTTSYDNYIKIYTTPTARHPGKWDVGKYRREVTGDSALWMEDENVRVEGLQMYSSNGYVVQNYGISGKADIRLSHNILKGNSTQTWGAVIYIVDAGGAGSTWKLFNNIIYGAAGTGEAAIYLNDADVTVYAYNNSVYSSYFGFQRDSNGVFIAKNNIVQNCASSDCYVGTFATPSDYNISDIAGDAPNATFATTSKVVQFVSTFTADFHLADTDTSAKGAGVNLYSDANINVVNDIDSAARPTTASGLSFDIGADQTAVKIYRSIAPSATTALTTGATNAMTISSSTSLATFATALADNIGVGDVIIYNTGGTATGTAFIHGRSSSTVYTVKTASGTAPTAITSDTSWSIYRAYTTLANAEAGTENTGIVNTAIRNFDTWSGGADLVASNTQWNIAAYANGTTADTAAVTINGWTTGQQNFIKVYTPVSTNEVGTTQRYQGKWDTAKYILSTNGYSGSIDIHEDFVKIYGLQIENTRISDGSAGGILYVENTSSARNYTFAYNIIKKTGTYANGYEAGIAGFDGARFEIFDNIIYGFDYGIKMSDVSNNAVMLIYNNTLAENSFYDIDLAEYNTNVTYRLKNNLAQSAVGYSIIGGDTTEYQNNISYDATSPNSGGTDCGGHSCRNQTVSFLDATNKDFHLAPTDTAALDAGTSTPATDANLSFTDDIDGQVRRQWDIGADEGSVEYVTSVMQSGGNFSSLSAWEAANQVDLTATTTAVFSLSSATGTIPANSSVMGLTSGAVGSTTVGASASATSTQILLYNIASSTFISGERIYIKGGATTSNYAILSNAGNPAIATAKIDGVWTGADQTAVDINGWTTAPNNYIRIYTTPTARHSGKWDMGKYRLDGARLTIQEDYARIDGLQIYKADSKVLLYENGGTIDIRVSSSIIKGNRSTGNYNELISDNNIAGGAFYFYNNVVYGGSTYSYRPSFRLNSNITAYLYNNTFSETNRGIGAHGGTIIAKNNIAISTVESYYTSGGSFNSLSANNLSNDNTAPGSSARQAAIVTFVDETNDDFHLTSADTGARNYGTSTIPWDSNLSFTQDIDGSYRGAAWDIGADEVPTEFVSTICENASAGGSCATMDKSTLASWESDVNSDLTATSTRVFSGSRTGTFADGATLTLYRGATSTGITAVAVATTSSQILLRNISAGINYSTTTISTSTSLVLNVQNGNQWRYDGSNYWTASGTADQLGASPIAVAKIDGAWANPDTTRVDINGWTTSYDNYIKIYTSSTARHPGKWDNTKYRLVTTAAGNYQDSIYNYEDYIWIDGLQIKTISQNYGSGPIYSNFVNSLNKIKISNNIITSDDLGTSSGVGSYDSDAKYFIWNNIIYDIKGDCVNVVNSAYIYNNTFYNCDHGILDIINKSIANNNLSFNSKSSGDYVNDFKGGTNNGSSDTTANNYDLTNGLINLSATSTFVDVANRDFHLKAGASVIGAGVNLYSDATSSVQNDIDSAARPTVASGLGFDIGADQTAVKIYRSIAPSATTALTTGASNAMTISSSTSLATFATALADNTGVGDVIIYNTGGTATGTAFIHGRASSTQYTVKTASGTVPTAVSADTSWSIYRAYTSLSNAEAGTENTGIVNTAIRNFDAWSGGADLVASNTQMNIAGYANGTTADTDAVTIDGWTTGVQNYIKIYTPFLTSEVGTTQRHAGKWDSNKYVLAFSIGGSTGLRIRTNNIKIDGLQVVYNSGNPASYGAISDMAENPGIRSIYISNNIIKGMTFGDNRYAGFYGSGAVSGKVMIWNNIFYDWKSPGSYVGGIELEGYGPTVYIYNNTFYDNNEGIRVFGGSAAPIAKNNIAQNNTDGYYGSFNNSSDYNISDIAGDAPNATFATTSKTVQFVDETNKDFHLAPTDTAALDAGTSTPATDANLSFTDDIDGQLRRQWDIGADEGSVEYVTSVMQSGGNFSTLSAWEAANQVDLTATTTAVFSLSSASGTIPANASVMGLTSGAIASTTVGSVSTSTQILLYNIASSTFVSGERIYVKGGATTSNYAIISNAGNPAIATAKIDGAWTSADATTVTIDGWTTGPNNYVRVYTTPTARHNGKWDDGKYRLATTADGILIQENYIKIDGIQSQINTPNYQAASFRANNISGPGMIEISNSIGKETNKISEDTWNSGIMMWTPSPYIILKAWNNVFYGFNSTINGVGIYADGLKNYIHNNTIYGSTYGIMGSRDGYGVTYAKNNITYNNTDNYIYSFDSSSSNNLSGPGTDVDIPSNGARNGYTVQFVDAANKDFHLSSSDTSAKNAGTNLQADSNLAFTQDLDGSYRGAAWDIGADEVPTEFVSTIMQSGGDYSTLSSWIGVIYASDNSGVDLSSSTTRVYYGGRTGTINPLASVTLWRSSTSTSVTATVLAIASSSSQILVRNIAGTTTPLNLVTGDQLRVDGSNYWTASGTADQLGASPIAVAKIDGAWTSADTGAVAIRPEVITSPDNYLKIYTTSAARHKGTAGSGYRLIVSSNSYPITDFTGSLRIDGLEIQSAYGAAGRRVIYLEPNTAAGQSGEIQISNNIVRGNGTSTEEGIMNANHLGTVKIWNNIIYDVATLGYEAAIENGVAATMYVYNNTIANTIGGFGIRQAAGKIIAKNNLVKSAIQSFYGTFDSSSDYNACGDSNCSGGAHDKINQTFNFVASSSYNYHLADTDTSAKGAGVNLYNDANINVVSDIDSAARPTAASGNSFDIGADQTAVKIYRSIAPSASSALASGAANALTISSSTSLATFATALADNIGVGDVIIYNTGGTATGTAFIHGRSSSTVYTVKTASGTAPTTVSADTSWSIYRAYTTLANAEASTENTGIPSAMRNFDAWSGGADLVASNTQWNIATYANGTTADTAAVTIDGWTTGPQNFIKVYTPTATSEVGTTQRHPGKWDDNKYRIEPVNSTALYILESYTRIEGIQVALSGTGLWRYGIESDTPAIDTIVSHNIVKDSGEADWRSGILLYNTIATNFRIFNNIVYGFKGGSTAIGIDVVSAASGGFVYNNTVYDSYNGFANSYQDGVLINNLANNCTNCYRDPIGDYAPASDYNISDLPNDAPSPSYRNNLVTVVSFVDTVGKDYHLSPSDTMALDKGTSSIAIDANLSFTDDIDGQLRRPTTGSGAGWDIGADEGSVEYVTSVMQAGGNFSTLSSWEAANQVDLTATTTAVFSLSSASGTIPANSSIMGLTSGAVASTTVGSVLTSTQILLYNIASSTFLMGERIYIKGGATTSNYAILSNAGNPAIATAKIDGAWTGADTTGVTINGWTTGLTNYVKIYTATAARHQGKWDDGKYRIVSGQPYPFTIQAGNVSIDGLQIESSGSGGTGDGILLYPGAADISISKNIIRSTVSNSIFGIDVNWTVPAATTLKASNNIIYDFGNSGISDNRNSSTQNSYLYNNTIINSSNFGIYARWGGMVIKNNIVQGGATNYGIWAGQTFNSSSTNNISQDTTSPDTTYQSKAVAFVDSTNKDFHLAPTDTAAKDAGAELSADTSLTLGMTGGVDIDGQKRGSLATSSAGGLGWDIGADEGATIMYRSVGNDTSNLNTGGATVTIASSTATFNVALPNNVGVGDVLQYGNSLTLAFITGRSSSTVYSIVNATGTYPVATTSASASIYRAHTLLNNWQTQTTGTVNQSINAGLRPLVLVARNLVASNTAMFVPAYASTSPDSTIVNINNWTTGAGNNIKIYTPVSASEVGITQRHAGKWDDNKYRIQITNGGDLFQVSEEFVTIDGIQIKAISSGGGYPRVIRKNFNSLDSNFIVSNNIIAGEFTSLTNYGTGFADYWLDQGVVKIYNNIIYGFTGGGSIDSGIGISGGLSYIYNNTFYNNERAIYSYGSATSSIKNNIAQNCTGVCYAIDADSGSSNNIASDNTAPGSAPKNSTVVNFLNTAASSTYDFHLAPTDRAARDSGVSLASDPYLPFTIDIDGNARPQGPAWDIGADEDAASNPDYRFNGWFKLKGFYKFR